MENKLQSMTDFVLYHPATTDYEWQLSNHLNYAKFLKQPLTLGMFVPCDKENNPLDFRKIEKCNCDGFQHYCVDSDKWEKSEAFNCENMKKGCLFPDSITEAKEKVLFKGFEFVKFKEGEILGYVKDNKIDSIYPFPNHRNYTIEDLVKHNIELTDSALKQIGLKTK